MGRLLEALRQAEATRARTRDTAGLLALSPAEAEADRDAPADEAVPFIEVGGPAPGRVPAGEVGAVASRGKVTAPAPSTGPVALWPVTFRSVGGRRSAGVPAGGFDPRLVTFHHPDHPISAQYRDLVTALCSRLDEGQPHILCVTGPIAGCGTTTILLNLAITVSKGDRSAVVVDTNWHRPAVASLLGLVQAPGLREVLAGKVPLEQALRETRQGELQALTVGEVRGGQAPRLEALPEILRRLRERCDLVLVDTPALDSGPEWLGISGACDGVYTVIDEAEADSPQTADLGTRLLKQGVRLRGFILTRRS